MDFNWFIGIDVSKKTFDVSFRKGNSQSNHSVFGNDKTGVKSFFKYLKEERVVFKECLVCLEHTGVYTHLLLESLSARYLNIWLEHPLTIKRSLGLQRGKNDKIDASRIAEYAHRFKDKVVLWEPARAEINRLKTLISLRFRLIKAKKMLAAPVDEFSATKAFGHKNIKDLTDPLLKKLAIQQEEVEQQIEEIITNDNHLKRLQEIITSVDGVGKVTAWQMIVTTNEFKDFKNSRKFACFSGVVPFDHSSGTSIYSRPRVSHLANKKMKEMLHMSALSATVMKGELNDYYNRKVEEGKNKMLVINNIRNKIIQRVFACVKENRKYEKSYMITVV